MHLANETNWDTIDLRKLVLANLKFAGVDFKRYKIRIKYGRRLGYHGWAWSVSKHIVMLIPKRIYVSKVGSDGVHYGEIEPNNIFDSVEFSQVFQHEVGHLRKLDHKDMIGSSKINCDWAKDFIVKPELPKLKKPRNIKQERYEKAKAKVKVYQSRLKNTQTLLKKWQKKVRYYEKKR